MDRASIVRKVERMLAQAEKDLGEASEDYDLGWDAGKANACRHVLYLLNKPKAKRAKVHRRSR